MEIIKQNFGTTKDGKEVYLYTLKNKHGVEATFTNYGANLVRLLTPDKNGILADIVLGYDCLEGYEKNTAGYGSFIGRNANRIANASFVLNKKKFELEKNDQCNNLHSGSCGYNKFVYEVECFQNEDGLSIEFSRLSPHLEQGFPGNLDITLTYTLTPDNELLIEYFAVSDQDTIVNLTNHSYFNLAGHNSGSIRNHKLLIESSKFTEITKDFITTGNIIDVTGTPMDFRSLRKIGDGINSNYEPIQIAGGYDHNYILDTNGQITKVVELLEETSGRKMEVYTDMGGLQLYTGNFIKPESGCKNNSTYEKHGGICFETQFYPNACNIVTFPSPILKAEQPYDYVTIFRFSTVNA